jgi:hypothetical protein
MMGCGAETEATRLVDELTKGIGFTIPTINFDDPLLNIPGDLNSDMYKVVKRLDIKELTTGEVGGSGAFDTLMASVYAHLRIEFDKGRITGSEYTRAYIELTQGVMANANQFVLNKDQAYWAAVNAQVAAIQARVALVTAKVQVAALQLEAMNQKANYALTGIRVANEGQQYCISTYNLEYMLPMELAIKTAQKEGQLVENQISEYNLDNTMPKQLEVMEAQKANTEAEAAIKQFERTDMLPQQKNILVAEAAMKEVERATAQSRLDNILPLEISSMGYENQIKSYTVSNILPLDVLIKRFTHEGLQVKNEIDQYNLNNLMPKQLAIAEVQRQTSQYTFDNILPKQAILMSEQAEGARAQTVDTRSDGITQIAGTLGAQKSLYAQQVISYQRDAQLKGAKLFTDAWTVQKTIDEGLVPPAGFTNSSLDVVLANVRSSLDLD